MLARPPILHYALNCGLLLLPVMFWNLMLSDKLPSTFLSPEFSRGIPEYIDITERSLRAAIFALPFAMPLEVSSPAQRRAVGLFAFGAVLYFCSWLPLLVAPASFWSTSALGFMAPAYTPAVWLLGLAMLGRRLYWGRLYRWWVYLAVSALFPAAHISHAAIVYARNY